MRDEDAPSEWTASRSQPALIAGRGSNSTSHASSCLLTVHRGGVTSLDAGEGLGRQVAEKLVGAIESRDADAVAELETGGDEKLPPNRRRV